MKTTHFLPRWLFLRLLGVIYFIAFASLGLQILGLVGKNGIVPAAFFLQAAHRELGARGYWVIPTVFWLNASDTCLKAACWFGMLISALLTVGIAPMPAASLLWLLYLSLSSVCGIFTGYQWDALLLETGFLAIFFAPLGLKSRLSGEDPPPKAVLWLLRWLLFRLMFSSGLVKLLSADPMWRSLKALEVHYQTQPLPTVLAWYAHQLPASLQKASCAIMFLIELAVPFLIFAPRRLRLAACGVFVSFMLLIMATGNYCFFNLVAIALAVLLLDDAALSRFLPKRLAASAQNVGRKSEPRAKAYAAWALCGFVLLVSGAQIGGLLLGSRRLAAEVAGFLGQFELVNSYGLFAVMTTTRLEIAVEGSRDAKSWSAYEFKWKPGDLKRGPGWVAPHQPRLDWQMWFAALGTTQDNPWFLNFLVRLLQGSPEVLALLERNPFPDGPPRYIRALAYEYRFTDFSERRRTGAWWKRELKGLYCPVITLQSP